MADETRESLRREGVGAFVHELRTPITSLRMVIELGRRSSEGPNIVLDDELVRMMESSLANLQELAESLQEGSWLERGKLQLAGGPAHLAAVVDNASARLGEHVSIECTPPDIEGPWDGDRLAIAMAGFANAANRCGTGQGRVRLACEDTAGGCVLRFEDGEPGGAARPVNADLGYAFFRGELLISAMGGQVDVERADGYASIRVTLPRS